jgi:diketogulonate reductase-like aldo/keto reductase
MASASVPITYKVLNDGNKMPLVGVGLGAWQSKDDEETLEEAVEIALSVGYTHFDTTPQNAPSVGKVLKKWIDAGKIKREELFVVSKLPMTAMWPYRVNEFLRDSLRALELDYVDLYLIKFPVGLQISSHSNATDHRAELPRDAEGNVMLDQTHLEPIWKAMENEVRVGRAKSIGVGDFNQEQVERILNCATIPPAVLQTEVNVYYQQKKMREFCQSKNIAVCAYAPLGTEDITDVDTSSENHTNWKVICDPAVKLLARMYGRTASQILLRFLVQSDVCVVPKCLNAFALKTCIKVCGFELKAEEMKLLEELDRGAQGHLSKTVFSEIFAGVENHPEYPWAKE